MSIFRKQDRLNSALWNSIFYRGGTDEIEKKIAAGAQVNAVYKNDYYRYTMLRWAVERNETAVVRLLLSKGADPNGGSDGDSSLMRAVQQKNIDAARALIDAGAMVDIKGYYGETPLIVAAAGGQAEMVKLLIERGAAVNTQKKDGNTALHGAAAEGYANLAAYLIEKGADPALTNGNMNTAADVAEKEYPGLAAMIRGKAEPEAEKPAEVDPGWRLVSPQEVAHVAMKDAVGYRVTEIFNFAARTYTHIASNVETKAESQAVKSFSELDEPAFVEKAYDELVRLGGKAVFTETGKKKLQSPGL